MKEQLVEKLHELLSAEDIMSIRTAVRDIRNDWKAETAKERLIQEEAFKATEQQEGAEFVYTPHELEGKFQDLLKAYEDRIEEHGKKLAAERAKNLEVKTAILADFENLVKDEQNIGKAFGALKELKEKWDATGDVPGDKHQDIHDKWHKLNHEFHYNINIYKTLQEHDLKINQKKKEEMIEEAKKLAEVETINDLELLVRKFQREWMNIGPSPRETYKEIGDTFFGILRQAQERINAHYEQLSAHSEENLAKKRALVDKMKEILSMEMTNASTWNRWTDEVLKLQEEWRTIGWARKKENEEVWQEFRGLCDLFFSKRNAFNDQRKEAYKGRKEKKQELIEKVKLLQDSTEWKQAAEEIKKLQEQWKAVGAADPRDEQKLWQKFRSHCDHFFNRRKEHFDKVGGQQEENLIQKDALLEEIAAFELTGNKAQDLATLKHFGERWRAIGFVPKEHVKRVMDKFNEILDAKYGQLNAEREQREMETFRNRLADIKGSQDGDFKLRKEKSLMREKIEKLKHQIAQYENNMGIFTGKGAEALRQDIEKKIKATRREIEDIKKKMDLLST